MRKTTRDGLYPLFVLGALAVILPAAGGPAMGQTTWYVDGDRPGGGANDGTSWTNAYEFLQDALHDIAIVDGDTILVAGGTYFPDDGDDVTEFEETESFELKNGVTVEGGYHGYCTACSDDLRDEVSILSGDIEGTGPSSGDSETVVTAENLASATVIDGFTITLGNADRTNNAKQAYGGGIFVDSCDDLTISNCSFERNHAIIRGGALFADADSTDALTITDCTFDLNTAGDGSITGTGGGAYIKHGAATLADVTFSSNESWHRAGGLHCISVDLTATRCDFTDNDTRVGGAAVFLTRDGAAGYTATFSTCIFERNTSVPPIGTIGQGGAVRILDPLEITFTGPANVTLDSDCEFTDNVAGAEGGAIGAHYEVAATCDPDTCINLELTDCTFDGNIAEQGENSGGTSVSAGGALWLRTVIADITNCTFRNNDAQLVDQSGSSALFGGGAIYCYGSTQGTWTGCTFIGNESLRGGAIYVRNETEVTIDDCTFIANDARLEGAGALCVAADPRTSTVTVCSSNFISNTAGGKGGAVYNHTKSGQNGSVTTMVNCIIAGNTAGDFGGGTCNAETGSTFAMHNCLLVGNVAEGSANQGGGHFNRLTGVSTLINCTVVKNEADGDAGGLGNLDANSDLIVRNCIVWGNTDGGADTLDAQLTYFTDAPQTGETDKNVIEDCTACFSSGGTNKGGDVNEDPDVVNTTTGMTWVICTYDAETGVSTFTMTVDVTASANTRFFQPESTSPLQLLIKTVAVIPAGADTISCYGKWDPGHGLNTKSGTIYDYHIASGSSAIDYGSTTYLADAQDPCDLNEANGTTEPLPKDLDLNDRREQGSNPDSGAYEIE